MAKTLQVVNVRNENGNVSVAVRNQIKAKATGKLVDVLGTGFAVQKGTDGAFYLPLYVTPEGETVSLRLEATVSIKDPNAAVVKKDKPAKEAVEIVLPDLE